LLGKITWILIKKILGKVDREISRIQGTRSETLLKISPFNSSTVFETEINPKNEMFLSVQFRYFFPS